MFDRVTLVSHPIPGQKSGLRRTADNSAIIPQMVSFNDPAVTDETHRQVQFYLDALLAGISSPSSSLYLEALDRASGEIHQQMTREVAQQLMRWTLTHDFAGSLVLLSEIVDDAYSPLFFESNYPVRMGAGMASYSLFLLLFISKERYQSGAQDYLTLKPTIDRMLNELRLPAIGAALPLCEEGASAVEQNNKAHKAQMLEWLTIAGEPEEVLTAAEAMSASTLKALYPNVAKYGPAGERLRKLQDKKMEVLLPAHRLSFIGMPVPLLELKTWYKNILPVDAEEYARLKRNVRLDFSETPSPNSEKNDAAELVLNAVATMHLLDEPDSLFEAHIEYLIRYMGLE